MLFFGQDSLFIMTFHEMNLREEIVAALDKLGYNVPTEVQEKVIPLGIEKKNIVVQSHTGSGKTAAFAIPLLNTLDVQLRKPQALIIAPTRELVMQTRDELRTLSGTMRMRSLAVFGGTSIRTQKFELDGGPQVIIATPGRLIDLIERKWIDLSAIETFVLDEVDQMLDMGFIDDVKYIWDSLPALKQVMTFSATYAPEIKALISGHMGMEYEFIQMQTTATVSTIDHGFMRVSGHDKYPALVKILEKSPEKRVIIFTRTKIETEDIQRELVRDGYNAAYLHGDLRQRDRIKTLRDYKEGRIHIFIATDIAARGLNLNNIEIVVNYHVPLDPEAYIHRIGRTGRAGASGNAIMFVAPDEMRRLDRVERTHKIQIKQIDEDGNTIERVRDQRSRGGDDRGGRGFGGRGGSGGGRSFGGDRGGRSFSGGEERGSDSNIFSDRVKFGEGQGEKREFSGERKPREERTFPTRERRNFGERKDFGDRDERGFPKGNVPSRPPRFDRGH